jgi:hypothetical protein
MAEAQASATLASAMAPALRRGGFPDCITSYGIGRSSSFFNPADRLPVCFSPL